MYVAMPGTCRGGRGRVERDGGGAEQDVHPAVPYVEPLGDVLHADQGVADKHGSGLSARAVAAREEYKRRLRVARAPVRERDPGDRVAW